MQRYFLLCLQIFQVGILLLHDWIPLPPLNDLRAVRKEHSFPAIALSTLLGSLFPSVGLVFSFVHWRPGWPVWLYIYLLAAYGFLFIGELQALVDSLPAVASAEKSSQLRSHVWKYISLFARAQRDSSQYAAFRLACGYSRDGAHFGVASSLIGIGHPGKRDGCCTI